ncbi:HSPA1s [Mytilus edulis]|uniref:HSPA1s n=1 Tax=Mytilus edulis TaxID=6550 RepID=A0A8S3PQ70_MYTED|nr:HSPA1s [Mytilus edulis]
MSVKSPAIGIDLGTTNSCVGVFQHRQLDIIANDQGNRTTPSYVAFTDTERLVGDVAKHKIAMNAENTIVDVKRLIGRNFKDSTVQADIKHWPFKVIRKGCKPNIQAEYKGETKTFSPEEISLMVLVRIMPSSQYQHTFNNSQRLATKDARFIAGLLNINSLYASTNSWPHKKNNVIEKLPLTSNLDKNLSGEKNVLIFDLGGGALDVLIVTIVEGSLLDVRSTAGNSHLGGDDFDNRIVNHFVNEFKRKYKKDISGNNLAIRKLRTACEKAKRALSSSTEVVLVGGSTRIPKIQTILSEFMNGKELNKSVNQDKAVACGAAVLAAILSGSHNDIIYDILIADHWKSTITNDKGRLSKEDIDRMVSDAEKYKEEDEKQTQRITSRNQLENYIFSVKQAIGDSGDKLSTQDKDDLGKACEESLKWLDNNSLAEKEEYDDKMKELQTVFFTVMSKLHGGAQNGQSNSTGGHSSSNGPTVEEVH